MSASSVDPRPSTATSVSAAEARRLQILTCLVFASSAFGMLALAALVL